MSRVFFNDTATTEIYTLSLHDALPIFLTIVSLYPEVASLDDHLVEIRDLVERLRPTRLTIDTLSALERLGSGPAYRDRKSTRLNSSHANISYAVFCLKKKNLTSLCCII